MKYGKDTKPDVFGWLTTASIDETKSHVSQASVGTLRKALHAVKGNKGKTEAIRRELFKRLEVGDMVIVPFTKKRCTITAISRNGQYLKLDNACGMYGWKDVEFYEPTF